MSADQNNVCASVSTNGQSVVRAPRSPLTRHLLIDRWS